EEDVVAHRAAEQVVDRQAAGLADDVPEGNIDAAHDVGGRPARPHIGEGAERLVPDRLDPGRIVTDQQLVDVPQCAGHRPVGDACRGGDFTPAGNPLVGAHFDEQILSPGGGGIGLDQPGNDGGDLHITLPKGIERNFATLRPPLASYQLAMLPSRPTIASSPATSSCWKGCLAASASSISTPRPGAVGTCQKPSTRRIGERTTSSNHGTKPVASSRMTKFGTATPKWRPTAPA